MKVYDQKDYITKRKWQQPNDNTHPNHYANMLVSIREQFIKTNE